MAPFGQTLRDFLAVFLRAGNQDFHLLPHLWISA
jgi:hypothetical protein